MVVTDTVDELIYKIQERKLAVNSAITSDLDGGSAAKKKAEQQEISKLVSAALHDYIGKQGSKEAAPKAVFATSSPGKRPLQSPARKPSVDHTVDLVDDDGEDEEEMCAVAKRSSNRPISLLESSDSDDE
jgi:hypothetical protein